MASDVRSSASITYTTWKALFLREAVNRLSTGRAAWLWILAEPAAHIALTLFVYFGFRARSIGGINVILWLMVGLLAFFAFKRTAQQSMNALSANKALFTYRQVKSVDTVIVRAGLEAFLMILVAVILFAGVALLGIDVMPADPLSALAAVLGLWMTGFGFGLIASVMSELVQETAKITGLAMMPLYFVSGVVFPVASVPQPYRGWLLYNPIVHGLEAARLGFAKNYYAVPGLSVAYLYVFALVTVFLGLALHVRFAEKVVAQ